MARQVLHIPGNWHGDQPIPPATKTGNLVTSGGVSGMNPDTGETSDDVADQAKWAFEHVKRIMELAGGTTDDVAHMNVYVKAREARPAINKEWVAMFPDAESRPTRHTIAYDGLAGNMQLQIQFIGYVS
jgi:2-iminobutanoate/2-iminopropanoate deaminase